MATPSLLMAGTVFDKTGLPELVKKLTEHLQCQRCKKVLINPHQMPCCGFRICSPCVNEIFAKESEIDCPFKDEEDCEEKLTKDLVYVDNFARRNLLKLAVYCKNKEYGCLEEMPWGKLPEHMSNCKFIPFPCLYASRGCEEKTAFKDFQKHTAECKYRPILCPKCDEVLLGHEHAQAEHDKVCPKFEVKCEKCEKELPREEMAAHSARGCVPKGSCEYAHYGCTFEPANKANTEKELEEHMKEDQGRHLSLVTRQCTNLQFQLDTERNRVGSMEKEVHTIHATMEKKYKSLELAQNGVRSLQLNAVKQLEFNQRLEDLTGRSGDSASSQGSVGTAAIAAASPVAGGMSHQATERVVQMTEQMERQISLLDVKLSEMALRFQVLETTSYDGSLLWRISDYSKRKAEAIAGRVVSLYSQPFYTSRVGYKMCARVYLNGDGMGKGSHMSMFFVIMKGDYDALLKWPFEQKVTLMLLDQEAGRNHLKDTFRPDVSSTSFKRPSSEMNVASGCPLFVLQTTLEQDATYIKDDAMFIRIKVDTEALRSI